MQPDEAAAESLEHAGTLSTPSPAKLDGLPVLPPGARLGPYSIQAVLGRGATAYVYRARDETLGREVALKVLHPGASENVRARFVRELHVIAGLQHPNIVGVFAAGEHEGRHFAAMELLPGSLADEMKRRGKLPWEEALRAARDACQGLAAAAGRSIVHRDVKPSNLLRDASGAVKVADFGLAKDVSRDLDLTLEGVVVGTPLYVSPEQGCGRPVDYRSDLYSLGASLYHMICGRPPFTARAALEVIVRHSVEPPPPLDDTVPPAVAALVLALLEKDPARRPGTHEGVVALIDEALAGGTISLPKRVAPRRLSADPLAASQLAAAGAALLIGRTPRAREIYTKLFEARGPGWIEAGLGLATLLEKARDFAAARSALEAVAEKAPDADTKALALWSLGALDEKEADAARDRALEAYARVLEVSETVFPKTLLEAKMAKLGGRKARA